MTFAAVLAGGIGSRMGAEMPKQYLKAGGKPILVRSVEQFACRDDLACVLVLTPEDWVSYTKDLLLQYGMGPGDVPVTVLAGGATRNDTLRNAIDYLEEHFDLDDDSVFITHDAVRPFLTQKMIDDNIAAVREHGACGTCIPATDTIVVSEDGTAISEQPSLPDADAPELPTAQTQSAHGQPDARRRGGPDGRLQDLSSERRTGRHGAGRGDEHQDHLPFGPRVRRELSFRGG